MLNLIFAVLLGAAEGPPMHEYALIFRPTRAVTAAELPKRNAAARDWALALRRDGVLSFAAPLEEEVVTITADGATSKATAPEVGAVLVVTAKDLQTVAALVKGHPGLAYGTSVEIRPLKATPPPPSR